MESGGKQIRNFIVPRGLRVSRCVKGDRFHSDKGGGKPEYAGKARKKRARVLLCLVLLGNRGRSKPNSLTTCGLHEDIMD